MFVLVPLLFPFLCAAICVDPGYPDGTKPASYLSYYEPDSMLSAWCYMSSEMTGISPNKKCQKNGSWFGLYSPCGRNVANDLVWKSSNGSCNFRGGVCNTATSWELSLEVVSYPDVEGFLIDTWGQEEETDYTIELISRTGESRKTTIAGAMGRVRGTLQLISVFQLKITSSRPIKMRFLEVYTLTGLPLHKYSPKDVPYVTTYNPDTRIVYSSWDEKENFTEAKRKCKMFGGRLLEALDQETFGYLQNLNHLPRVWIGLVGSNNSWTWNSGRVFIQDLFQKFPIATRPSIGLAVAYDYEEEKLIPTDQSDKIQFACRLDSLPTGCMSPGCPAAGRILRNNNEQTEYECFTGYKMEGEAVRKCDLKKGKYLTEMPVCVKENSVFVQ